MKKILIILSLILVASIAAAEDNIIAGDEFCYDVNVTNTNNYRASFEFYMEVLPDSEGFDINIVPAELVFDAGQTNSVTVSVNSSMLVAPDAYTFILKYNVTKIEESENGGSSDGNGGGGGSGSGMHQDPSTPPNIPPYVPPEPPDIPRTIYVTWGDIEDDAISFSVWFVIIFIIMMLILLIYKKVRGNKNEKK